MDQGRRTEAVRLCERALTLAGSGTDETAQRAIAHAGFLPECRKAGVAITVSPIRFGQKTTIVMAVGLARRPSRATTAAWSSGIISSWWPVSAIPSAPGRWRTLSRPRYFWSKSRLAVVRPSSDRPRLRAIATALRKTSGRTTALPRLSQTPPAIRATRPAEAAEVVERRLAQRGAVEPGGHVDDVGADRDVDRQRDARPTGGDQQARRRAPARRARRSPRPSAAPRPHAVARRPGRRPRRTARRSRGRSRTSRPSAGGRRPRWSGRRSPARGRGSPPSRSGPGRSGRPARSSRSGTGAQPVLIDVPAQRRDDRPAPPRAAATIASRSRFKPVAGEQVGQAVEPVVESRSPGRTAGRGRPGRPCSAGRRAARSGGRRGRGRRELGVFPGIGSTSGGGHGSSVAGRRARPRALVEDRRPRR